MTSDRFECAAHTGEDTVAVAGLSFGVGVLSAMAASVVLTIATLALRLPDALSGPVVLAGSIAAGVYVAHRFWRWRKRVAAERKLVIDDAGITYVALSDKQDTTRWEEIERVVQTVAHDPETSYTFVVHRRGRRKLELDGNEFPDYEGVKQAIRRRIGDRLVLK